MFSFLLNEVPLALLVLGVLTVLLLLRQGLRLLRLRPAYRERLNRVLPVAEVVAGFLFVVWAASLFLPGERGYSWILAGVLALGLLAAGWFTIRDFVSGVILRAENGYRPRQWIRVGETEGLIRKVGYRALVIETEEGFQVRLPYSRLSAASLVTADRSEASKAHTFRLAVPGTRPAAEVMVAIRAAALNAFWSSITREPFVQLSEPREGRQVFQVTVYALDEAYVGDIELAVRRQLGDDPSGVPAPVAEGQSVSTN